MSKFRCKHCRQAIIPCKNHDLAKWQLEAEDRTAFLRWTCLLAPDKFVWNPRGTAKAFVGAYSKANKGSMVVGLHEPDLKTIAASLDEMEAALEG